MMNIGYNNNNKQQYTTMPNYQEGKHYKIYNTINDDIYIGSTTRKLCERMRNHRSSANFGRHVNYNIYLAFKEHGVENFYIELIEKCPCHDKEELSKKEGEYIRKLRPTLNMKIAGRTTREYYNEHKEHISQIMKDYRGNNKEYLRELHKQYYENNKDSLMERAKQYRETNKELIIYKKKQSYEHNKEDINSHRRQAKITCECGCIVNKHHLARHKRSAKHQKLMTE